ncbi:MAG: hypothetical protein ACRD0A_11715 [Acidimicrobiales bacterium]
MDPPRQPERGATRAQYLVFLVLVLAAFAVTAILLWTRIDGDSGFAVSWFS